MKANDLQIRIARKMKSGRGSMMITQDDLDTLVQCGAYTALCNAATEELRQRGPKKTTQYPDVIPSHEEVEAALSRAINLTSRVKPKPV